MSRFTDSDAANLIAIARRAPLKNMDEAKKVNDLLERFIEFYQGQSKEDEENGSV